MSRSRRRTIKKRGGGDPHTTGDIMQTHRQSVYMVCGSAGPKTFVEVFSAGDTCGIFGPPTGRYLAWTKKPDGTMSFNKDYPSYDAAKAAINMGGRRKRKTSSVGRSRRRNPKNKMRTMKYW